MMGLAPRTTQALGHIDPPPPPQNPELLYNGLLHAPGRGSPEKTSVQCKDRQWLGFGKAHTDQPSMRPLWELTPSIRLMHKTYIHCRDPNRTPTREELGVDAGPARRFRQLQPVPRRHAVWELEARPRLRPIVASAPRHTPNGPTASAVPPRVRAPRTLERSAPEQLLATFFPIGDPHPVPPHPPHRMISFPRYRPCNAATLAGCGAFQRNASRRAPGASDRRNHATI